MATLYPEYEIIVNSKVPPTEGELIMLDFLVKNLDDTYEIYFQPFLNGDCPDIVLMRKGGGVLIIEVKDWSLGAYDIDYKKRWSVKNGNQIPKSPINQVLKYKENIYDLHIDNLLELRLKDYKYWFVVNCAVFFYKENKEDVENFILSPFNKQKDLLDNSSALPSSYEELKKSKENYLTFLSKNIVFIGKNNLNKEFLNKILYEKWISKNSYYFNNELYESFKRYLKPSFHSCNIGASFHYTKKQLKLSVSRIGEQKIRGVAGAGKTLVLAKRAVNAYKRTKGKILILTYNISLRNYIHDKISNVREDFHWDNFRIVNYHDFYNSTMNNLGIEFDIPENFNDFSSSEKAEFFNSYYDNIGLLEGYEDNIELYSAIFIDEVQDYKSIWLRIIKKFFLQKQGEFVVFGDGKQDIYNRVSLVNNKKVLVIPDSPGRWSELNQSFRLTPTITSFAVAFQKKYLQSNHEPDTFKNIDFQSALFDRVHYKSFDTNDSQIIAKFILDYSIVLNSHPNDVCVLSSNIDTVKNLDFFFRKLSKEKTYIMSETKEYFEHLTKGSNSNKKLRDEVDKIRKNKKLHFWMNSGVTKFSTIHSYKGWEIKTLFLVIHKGALELNYSELIYTGITRCMVNLIVIDVEGCGISSFMSELQFVNNMSTI